MAVFLSSLWFAQANDQHLEIWAKQDGSIWIMVAAETIWVLGCILLSICVGIGVVVDLCTFCFPTFLVRGRSCGLHGGARLEHSVDLVYWTCFLFSRNKPNGFSTIKTLQWLSPMLHSNASFYWIERVSGSVENTTIKRWVFLNIFREVGRYRIAFRIFSYLIHPKHVVTICFDSGWLSKVD